MELSTICRQLKVQSQDGKKYTTDCANTERELGRRIISDKNNLDMDTQLELEE